jgi:hypothetical protein
MGKYADVEAYIEAVPPELREVARGLCDVVRAAVPDAAEAIKWSMPTWSHHGPFCYVKAFARHVNLGFWRGMALDDPNGLIGTTGEKMGHVSFTGSTPIDADALAGLIRQAASLNEILGDPSRTR